MKLRSSITMKLSAAELDALVDICIAAEGHESLTIDAQSFCFQILDTFLDREETIELGATLQ